MSQPPVDVRVARSIVASPEQVFDAWLDPARARRFLFATAAGKLVRAEIDPRVGGRFTMVDRRDGVDVEHTGTYVELDRPRRLVFDFTVPAFSDHRTRVSVDITPHDDGGSDVGLTAHDTPAEHAERARAGWGTILDALARALVDTDPSRVHGGATPGARETAR
jgi:uncharacterized protein YndB with AHSA1/START domain